MSYLPFIQLLLCGQVFFRFWVFLDLVGILFLLIWGGAVISVRFLDSLFSIQLSIALVLNLLPLPFCSRNSPLNVPVATAKFYCFSYLPVMPRVTWSSHSWQSTMRRVQLIKLWKNLHAVNIFVSDLAFYMLSSNPDIGTHVLQFWLEWWCHLVSW